MRRHDYHTNCQTRCLPIAEQAINRFAAKCENATIGRRTRLSLLTTIGSMVAAMLTLDLIGVGETVAATLAAALLLVVVLLPGYRILVARKVATELKRLAFTDPELLEELIVADQPIPLRDLRQIGDPRTSHPDENTTTPAGANAANTRTKRPRT